LSPFSTKDSPFASDVSLELVEKRYRGCGQEREKSACSRKMGLLYVNGFTIYRAQNMNDNACFRVGMNSKKKPPHRSLKERRDPLTMISESLSVNHQSKI